MARLTTFLLTTLPAWVLGGVFLVAAAAKLADPIAFADQIAGFELLPIVLVAPTAILLPGVELVTGAVVLLPAWRRSAAIILAVLLLVFLVAAVSVIARGLDVPCGCFGSSQRRVGWGLIIQDLLLLALALRVGWAGAGAANAAKGPSCAVP